MLLLGGVAVEADAPETVSEVDPVAIHLKRGQDYLTQGEYAKAVLEFEQVLTFDNLPPDLHEQAEIYARAARDYAQGKRLSAFGYAETGGGHYRENVTRSTRAAGGDPTRDWFWAARAGGGVSYIARDDLSIDGTLDYRYRYYDDPERRDDSDLRWSTVVNHSLPEGSQAIGLRGRASYRGADGYRQDYGLFVNRGFNLDPDNRVAIEAEIRTRQYPRGQERSRNRNTGQLWLSWTRALMDGRGSLTLTALAGREWATNDRPDGNQDFYGVTFDFGVDVKDNLGFFLSGLYEYNGYDEEHPVWDAESETLILYSRSDDVYELGAGLTWGFAPGWSLRPEVLWARDESNTLPGNYSSTEVWMMVRKSF